MERRPLLQEPDKLWPWLAFTLHVEHMLAHGSLGDFLHDDMQRALHSGNRRLSLSLSCDLWFGLHGLRPVLRECSAASVWLALCAAPDNILSALAHKPITASSRRLTACARVAHVACVTLPLRLMAT